MTTQSTQNGQTVHTIYASDVLTRASFVPALGGIGSSITMPDRGTAREMLYRHDFFWDEPYTKTRGGWPFLFPVCGRLERDGAEGVYLHDGQRHELPIHGFSLRVPWRVSGVPAPDALTMELSDSEATRAAYPFEFRVALTYRVRPGVLSCELRVENRGAKPMPYYCGFHPYFLTPPAGAGKEQTRVEVEARRQWLYNEKLTDIRGQIDPPAFPAELGDPAVREILTEVGEKNVSRLRFPDGFHLSLEVTETSAPAMFPFVQLYTMPERPFYCIEPWMGHPNSLNAVTGVRWLAPGAKDRAVVTLSAGR